MVFADIIKWGLARFKDAAPITSAFLVTPAVAAKAANGVDIACPAATVSYLGRAYAVPAATLTPPLPSRTIWTKTGTNVYTIVQPAQQLARQKITVVNSSATNRMGESVTITGLDERGYALSDTVPIDAPGNTTKTFYTTKYFTTISALSGSAGMNVSTITITAEEWQIRGRIGIKPGASGYAWAFYWVNEWGLEDIEVGSFEVQASGLVELYTTVAKVGPQHSMTRLQGPVQMSGGRVESPPTWRGNCIYAAVNLLDGSVVIAGNSALMSRFDGRRWSATFTPPDLYNQSAVHIIAMHAIGLDQTGKETVYIGTTDGRLIRWNVTDNIFTWVPMPAWVGAATVQFLCQGAQTNHVVVGGDRANLYIVVDRGISEPLQIYDQRQYTPFYIDANNGSPIYGGFYASNQLFLVGGGSNAAKFVAYDPTAVSATDLSPFLPGPVASSVNAQTFYYLAKTAADRNGTVWICGKGGNLYLARWDTRQSHARTRLTFTIVAGAAATIPAGFTVSTSGGVQYKTVYPLKVNNTGATTLITEAVAVTPGLGGCTASSTLTTLVDSHARVSGVMNTEPGGMGYFVSHGGQATTPGGMLSLLPTEIGFNGNDVLVLTAGGDVLRWDGQLLSRQPHLVFKGRGTKILQTLWGTLLLGDEGIIWWLP